MSDDWIGDVFERLQKDIPEKEWERLDMTTLDDKALEAAYVSFSVFRGDHKGRLREAITAYLTALPIPEGEVGETVKALHRLSGELPPGTRGHDAALRAADLIIRQQEEIEKLHKAYQALPGIKTRALHGNTQSHRSQSPVQAEGDDLENRK